MVNLKPSKNTDVCLSENILSKNIEEITCIFYDSSANVLTVDNGLTSQLTNGVDVHKTCKHLYNFFLLLVKNN